MFLSKKVSDNSYIDVDSLLELLEAAFELVVDPVELLARDLVELLVDVLLLVLLQFDSFFLSSFLFLQHLGYLSSWVEHMLLLNAGVHVNN